jgi:hypothetical protein
MEELSQMEYGVVLEHVVEGDGLDTVVFTLIGRQL